MSARSVERWLPISVSLVLHTSIAIAALLLPTARGKRSENRTVILTDLKIPERPRPLPPKPKEVKPPEPKPEPKKVAMVKRPEPRPEPPPPEPEPKAEPKEKPDKPPDTGPKTFGIQMEGTTNAGTGDGVKVPVGDSLAVRPTIRKKGPATPPPKTETGFKQTYARGEQAPVAVVTTPPKVRKQVQPEYPERMRELGIEGRVILELTLDEQGRVVAVKVVTSLRKELDDVAVVAARQLLFSPALVNGKAVAVKIPYTFTFVLD
jgi:periplasmic protein TonB